MKKRCNKCLLIKPTEQFNKNKWHKKDGRKSICKRCDYLRTKKYESENREKVNSIHRMWRKKNIEKCRELARRASRRRRKEFPWEQSFYMAKSRCQNQRAKNFKYYGGRGIELLITKDEVKKIWFRDRAYTMNRPSIDRINPDGNYHITNCRFIELSLNSKRKRKSSVPHKERERNKLGRFI